MTKVGNGSDYGAVLKRQGALTHISDQHSGKLEVHEEKLGKHDSRLDALEATIQDFIRSFGGPGDITTERHDVAAIDTRKSNDLAQWYALQAKLHVESRGKAEKSPRSTPVARDVKVTHLEGLLERVVGNDARVVLSDGSGREHRVISALRMRKAGVFREGQLFVMQIRELSFKDGVRVITDISPRRAAVQEVVIRPKLDPQKFHRQE